jgi:uncharacterized protein (TIGR02145 family)
MSYKIIRVLNGVVSIASSDGTFFNVPIEELDFNPKAGDEVQCFRNGEKVIVFKNSLKPHSKNTVSKNESQGIVQNTPIGNPLADELVEKKSRLPWIVGIILLLVGVLFACIYLKNSNAGTMTDSRDGKKYKTVKIGSQNWMAENLNYDIKHSYCYDDDPENCQKYGRLYTWAAALNACPSGYHLPTKEEFETLISNVGGDEVAAKMLKSTTGWYEDANGLDAFGFSVLPVGLRISNGKFLNAGKCAGFWSATEDLEDYAYRSALGYARETACLYYYSKDDAYSVRCLKD